MSVKVVSQNVGAVTSVSREYWLAVLDGLAPTRVPRWSEESDEGIDTIERVVPDDLHDALERLALRQAVPLGTLVLTAHVKVLTVLSGERQVTFGYVAVPGRVPVPCRVAVPDGAWRDLLHATARAESELLPHHSFPEARASRRSWGCPARRSRRSWTPRAAPGHCHQRRCSGSPCPGRRAARYSRCAIAATCWTSGRPRASPATTWPRSPTWSPTPSRFMARPVWWAPPSSAPRSRISPGRGTSSRTCGCPICSRCEPGRTRTGWQPSTETTC